ncbi:MAG: alpha-mannosidase [Candidatus Saccharimonadales bacterium]
MSVQEEERALEHLLRFILMYVPRTHFDLAWWMIRRLFVNFRFEPVMSALVATLEKNPSLRFTVDGQAYLVFRWITNTISPLEIASRTQRVMALVRSGQLQVGPSWILPDEFLARGESQIRNLLIGRKVSRELGAPKLQVVDHSDVFGHPAQIPQIISAFTGTYMFTRGLAEEQIQNAAFKWMAPNAEWVIGIAHPGGYGNGYEFASKNLEISLRTVRNFLNNYYDRYIRSGVLLGLLCGGGDHTALASRIVEDIEAAIQAFPDIDIVIGTNNDYAARLNLDPDKLPVIQGELFASGRQNILRDVSSARMYLKQRHDEVFTVLMNAETAVSLCYVQSKRWIRHLVTALERCWADFTVLDSHDGLPGCHVDDVAEDMLGEYNNIEQELHVIMQTAMCELAGVPFEMAYRKRYGLVPTPQFGLWNPLPYARSEVVIVDLPEELQGTSRLKVLVNGEVSEIQRLDAARAALWVATGSFGSSSVKIAAEKVDVVLGIRSSRTINNEHLRVQVHEDGIYDVTDKSSGRKFSGLGRLTSEGDRGDEYNRDLLGDQADSSGTQASVCVTVSGRLVQEIEIKFDFSVPERLNEARDAREGRVTIPVVTTLRLRKGSRHLEINTRIDNRASDQLLRVEFPVGEKLEESRALSVFIVQPHPVLPPLNPDWQKLSTDFEPPFNSRSNQGMVMAGPFVSFNRGLTEYEVYDTPAGKSVYAHTLLRCVGFLSRDDIRTRRPDPGSGLAGAGPQLKVPAAQCLGEQSFTYTLGFVGDSSGIDLAQASQKWHHGFVTAPFEVNTNGIVTWRMEKSVFSALKPAEDGRGLILRSWAGAEPTWMQLEDGGFTSRHRVTVAEEPSSHRGLYIGSYGIGSVYFV